MLSGFPPGGRRRKRYFPKQMRAVWSDVHFTITARAHQPFGFGSLHRLPSKERSWEAINDQVSLSLGDRSAGRLLSCAAIGGVFACGVPLQPMHGTRDGRSPAVQRHEIDFSPGVHQHGLGPIVRGTESRRGGCLTGSIVLAASWSWPAGASCGRSDKVRNDGRRLDLLRSSRHDGGVPAVRTRIAVSPSRWFRQDGELAPDGSCRRFAHGCLEP